MKGCGREHIEIMQEDTSDWNAQECVQQQTCVDVVYLWQCSALPVSLMICVDMCFFLLGTIHPPVLSLMNAQLYLHCELSALVDLDLVRQLFLEFHRTFFFFFEPLQTAEEGSQVKSKESASPSELSNASQITSCTEGTAPSEPFGATSRRDVANAFVAAQPKQLLPSSEPRSPTIASQSPPGVHGLRPERGRRRTLQFLRSIGLPLPPPTRPDAPQASFGYVPSLRLRASVRASPPGSSVLVQKRHHSGVDGQVDASVVRRPVPPLPAICGTYGRAVPDPCRAQTVARTLAPPTLHTLATAYSNAQPLGQHPCCCTWWWPRASRGLCSLYYVLLVQREDPRALFKCEYYS